MKTQRQTLKPASRNNPATSAGFLGRPPDSDHPQSFTEHSSAHQDPDLGLQPDSEVTGVTHLPRTRLQEHGEQVPYTVIPPPLSQENDPRCCLVCHRLCTINNAVQSFPRNAGRLIDAYAFLRIQRRKATLALNFIQAHLSPAGTYEKIELAAWTVATHLSLGLLKDAIHNPEIVHRIFWNSRKSSWADIAFGIQLPMSSFKRLLTLENYVTAHNPAVYDEIDRCRTRGYLTGPFQLSNLNGEFAVAPLGSVTKKDSGKARCVIDLTRAGVNAQLPLLLFTFPALQDLLGDLYQGAWIFKCDLRDGFFHQKVRPQSARLLGIRDPRNGLVYFYNRLPFGLSVSPFYFSKAVAEFQQRVRDHPLFAGIKLVQNVCDGPLHHRALPPLYHIGKDGIITSTINTYMDDVMGFSPSLLRARLAMRFAVFPIGAQLGLTFKHSKTVDPTQKNVELLGIGADTIQSAKGPTLIVPEPRRVKLRDATRQLLKTAQQDHPISRRNLASLAGSLCSVAAAIPAGNTFLRRIYDVLHWLHLPPPDRPPAHDYTGFVNPSPGLTADLQWWTSLLEKHDGRTLKRTRDITLVHAVTDASGSGVGATVTSSQDSEAHYLSGVWPSKFKTFSSNWRELRAILLALQRVKRSKPDLLQGAVVYSFTDNSTAAFSINRGTSKSKRLMHMIRELKLLEVELDCTVVSVWMSGDEMIKQGTDALSRGVLHDAHSGAPCLLPTDAAAPLITSDILLQLPALPAGATLLMDPQHWYHRSKPPPLPVIVPPPSLMRQAVHQTMEWYRDQPETFEGYVVVPVVHEHAWWRLRRYFTTAHYYTPPPPWPDSCSLVVLCRMPFSPRPNPRYQAAKSADSADCHPKLEAQTGSNVAAKAATSVHIKPALPCQRVAGTVEPHTTTGTTLVHSARTTSCSWSTCARVVARFA